jgi:hypothetical protein
MTKVLWMPKWEKTTSLGRHSLHGGNGNHLAGK